MNAKTRKRDQWQDREPNVPCVATLEAKANALGKRIARAKQRVSRDLIQIETYKQKREAILYRITQAVSAGEDHHA